MPFLELNDMSRRDIAPGCHAKFVHGDRMTVSYWNLDSGAVIPEHSHPHEQVTSLISGSLRLTLDGEEKLLGPGSVVAIPPEGKHSVIALEESYVIDVFAPVREDYR